MKNCLGPTEEVDISFSRLPSLPLTVRVVLGHMHHLFAGLGKAIQDKCSIRYLETELCSPLMFMSQELVNIEIFFNTP